MHTILVVAGGLLLLGLFVLVGRMTAGGSAATASWALYFLPVWLAAAAINMWIGVSRAGYTVTQEFPIFLVVFAIPAAAAGVVWWMASRGQAG